MRNLFDYLPDNSAMITTGDHHGAAQHFWQEVNTRFEEYGIDPTRPLLPPARCFMPVEELYQNLASFAVLELRQNPDAAVHRQTPVLPPPDLADDQRSESPTDNLVAFWKSTRDQCCCAPNPRDAEKYCWNHCASTSWRRRRWTTGRLSSTPDLRFAIATAPLDRGLYLGPEQPTLICEAQLFGNRVAQRRRRKSAEDSGRPMHFKRPQ